MLMGEWRADVTDDVDRARDDTTPFLLTEPVHHNLILTLLEQRRWLPEPGSYGVVRHNGDVVIAMYGMGAITRSTTSRVF